MSLYVLLALVLVIASKSSTFDCPCPSVCNCYYCPHGVCEFCKPDNWGPSCDQLCPEGCKKVNFVCGRNTGICTNGCTYDRWGTDFCEKLCSNDCGKVVGIGNKCDRDTGVCVLCPLDRWGEFCENLCSSDCYTGGSSHYCDRDTGVCTECTATHWGNFCENLCSSDCDTGYSPNCNRNTGVCYKCPATRWGKFCENLCSSDCDTGYSPNCIRDNGDCIACPVTRWGTNFCQFLCPANCDTGYTHNCDRNTALCTACKGGYNGPWCQTNMWFDTICRKSTDFVVKKVLGVSSTCLELAFSLTSVCIPPTAETIVGPAVCVAGGIYVWALCNNIGLKVIKSLSFGLVDKVQVLLCGVFNRPPQSSPLITMKRAYPTINSSDPSPPNWPQAFSMVYNVQIQESQYTFANYFSYQRKLSFFGIFNPSTNFSVIYNDTMVSTLNNTNIPQTCARASGVQYQFSQNPFQNWLDSQAFFESNKSLIFVGAEDYRGIPAYHWKVQRFTNSNDDDVAELHYYDDQVSRAPIGMQLNFGSVVIYQQQVISFDDSEPPESVFYVPPLCPLV